MKTKISFCFVLVVLTGFVNAQACFEKVFRHFSNDFYLQGSVTTSDSALVMSSYNSYSGESNIIKVNESGQTEWLLKENDSARVGKPVRIGSTLYFMGFASYPLYKPYVLAMNEDGQKLWSKKLFSDSGYTCSINDIATDGTNLYMLLTFKSTSNYNTVFPGLICLDTLGNISWVKRYSTGGYSNKINYNAARDEFVMIVSDGVYSFIICADPDGNTLWSKSIDIMFNGSVFEIIPDASGSQYLLLGMYHYNEPFLLNVDAANGNLNWSRMIYFNYMNSSSELCLAPGGGFYLGAKSNVNTALIKFDANGHFEWAKKYLNTSSQYGYPNMVTSIWPGSSGRIWIAGDHVASGNFRELFCVLADSSGNTGCQSDLVMTDSACAMTLINTSFQSQPVQMTEQNVFETFTVGSLTQQLLCVSTVGITETEKTSVSVFPNPASSVLNFQLGEKTESRTIHIYDSFGREMLNQETDANTFQISVADFASGLYSYRLESKTSKTVSGNFVVE